MRHLLLASLLTFCASAVAAPAWIDDQVLVPMRSGAGTSYRIIQNAIKSGTRVEAGESADGWTQIQYNGMTGYVPSQYLVNQPTAALQLAALQKKYDNLKADYDQIKTQLSETSKAHATLEQQAADLQKQLASSNSNLSQIKEVAANPLRISEANKQLNEQLSLLQTQLDQVKVKNSLLEHDKTYQGWAFGLGTVILGMLLGAWIKSRGQRSRSGWA